jgi:hypothetical protein
MPSKSTYLIAFLVVTTLSFALHFFVFAQLKRLLRKDFGMRAKGWIRAAGVVFIGMDFLFVLLFFRKQIPWDIPGISQILLYPFTVWQFLMLVWGAVLIPQVLARNGWKAIQLLRGRKIEKAVIDDPHSMPVASASLQSISEG